MTPHPALALLRCGDVPEAIRLLEASGDHPFALSQLRIGFLPEAILMLENYPPGYGVAPAALLEEAPPCP